MQTKLKIPLLAFIVTFQLFFPHNLALGLTKNSQAFYAEIDISQAPQKADWQYFMQAEPDFRKNLWNYYAKQGKNLASWAWGWRIGWLNTCTYSREKWCWDIFKSALVDQALVVRSQAAIRLGERFKGTKNAAVIRLLTVAYKNKGNSRGGKPLFVQNRILFAIKEIGGTLAVETGEGLARSHPVTLDYWKKLL